MLQLHGVPIVDTFVEAFSMRAARVIVSAVSEDWARTAAVSASGAATSVIDCDCEAALEAMIPPELSPDGRPAASVLMFAFTREALAAAVQRRVGQCVLTCATTACFNGLEDVPEEDRFPVGGYLRYFGDGFQSSTQVGEREMWSIPVMDGEFLCEETFGCVRGIAGGNLLLCGDDPAAALSAAVQAVAAMRTVPGVILPFPGGIVRSGSKVGSRYKKLKASTNDAYCPTLRGRTTTALPEGCQAVYELIVDGLSPEAVQTAMRLGLHAACAAGGLLQVTAGNYGGRLGKHQFPLRDLL